MFKACSRCGRVHDSNYNCTHNKPKFDYSRYSDLEERKLRSTAAWTNKSIEIREAAQYLCEVCRDKGVYNYNGIEVHHIEKLRKNKEGFLNNTNLICLCEKHHKQADKGLLDADYLRDLARRRDQNNKLRGVAY